MKKKFRRRNHTSKMWLSNFSSNILGVIIGIALTFGITFWIQRHQEKKQLHEMVMLLKREIEGNKKWLENRSVVWQKDFKAYWVVLWKQDWDSISKERLDSCVNQLRNIPMSVSTTYVWNMFQNSGMAKSLHNVELVANLSECYFWSEEMKEMWKTYCKRKEILSNIWQWEFASRPLGYFEALQKDKEAHRFLDEIAMYEMYSFPSAYKQIEPFYNYIIYLLDNYDKPKKIRGLDFESFQNMQRNKTGE